MPLNRVPTILVAAVLLTPAAVVLGDRSTPPASTAATEEAFMHAENLALAFQTVAERVQASVVSVRSAQEVVRNGNGRNNGNGNGNGDPFLDSPLRDFFDRLGGDETPEQRRFFRQGQGSGFIVSPDGYIVTNNHVVANARRVTVRLSDDRAFRAEVIGTDPKTDLAVIRIDAGELLPALPFGDSESLRVGQWVVAAGNPFGLASSITAGIVSAKGRSRVGITDYEDFIQTDAAINPGNSGGPLVNLYGQVVGVNTAIFSRTGGSMGVGFAIPIDLAEPVVNSLIADGTVVRGWLGVSIQNLDPAFAEAVGFDGTEAVRVGDVLPEGPAERAGLRSGDLLTRLGESTMNDVDQLRFAVAAIRPGTVVDVEVFRDGSTQVVPVEIGRLAD
ncbi:MAG: trypsin-like serine protease [Phycisphaerales bacterium]|nr:trypsin-like peptidase domain-containing protein [Phycisphaerae bacterium]NNF43490.1 trypsin-like serine protease [Phycisphaerales bacterium]NNM26887.1 trypsin-like serine protease [Phycisphaerales bacterium]